ncbi:hypothetical protein NDU88_005408 [Pleurodeles waltl]|uniref:Uncharacterized protein n=1 Tax=Pleurodeles waltl TaxID=8319 RepID=A0AAV7PFB4_PLEWA|nr:hypothetical protein NDU88_005408 [Pleurodeles waltl]
MASWEKGLLEWAIAEELSTKMVETDDELQDDLATWSAVLHTGMAKEMLQMSDSDCEISLFEYCTWFENVVRVK